RPAPTSTRTTRTRTDWCRWTRAALSGSRRARRTVICGRCPLARGRCRPRSYTSRQECDVADYPFVNLIAYDSEAGALAQGATGNDHASPYKDGEPVVTSEDVSGIEIAGAAVASSPHGTLTTFTAETGLVVWVSGSYRTVLESTQGMRDAAV